MSRQMLRCRLGCRGWTQAFWVLGSAGRPHSAGDIVPGRLHVVGSAGGELHQHGVSRMSCTPSQVTGRAALQSTTLQSLGLTGGSAIIR